MSGPFGLQSSGFVPMALADIESAIAADQIANTPTIPQAGPHVGLNTAFARRMAEGWQMAAQAYANRDPAALAQLADGTASAFVDQLCAITGTLREKASYSFVTLTVQLAAGVTLQAGSQARDPTITTYRWTTQSAVTNTSAGTQYFSVLALCTLLAPVAAAPTTITAIATPVSGWLR